MKDKFELDVHMHTIVSGHAYGTIREMVAAAKEKDLKLIGISEHGPGIPGTCSYHYFLNHEAVPRFINGIEVLFGCEANVNNEGKLLLKNTILKHLDYCIVGIHTVNNLYTDQGIDTNTDNLIKCMKNPKVYIVSHPDNDATPLDYDRLAKAAKEYHVALEVNNSSLLHPERRIGCVKNYHMMLEACMKYRTNIIIDSDAHDPSAVANFSKAIELIEETHFDEELILNTSVEKFKTFINYQD